MIYESLGTILRNHLFIGLVIPLIIISEIIFILIVKGIYKQDLENIFGGWIFVKTMAFLLGTLAYMIILLIIVSICYIIDKGIILEVILSLFGIFSFFKINSIIYELLAK